MNGERHFHHSLHEKNPLHKGRRSEVHIARIISNEF